MAEKTDPQKDPNAGLKKILLIVAIKTIVMGLIATGVVIYMLP